MHVLHVIDSDGLYGAEVVLLNLMEAQKEMGMIPSLLSIGNYESGQKSIEVESKNRGLHVVTLRFRDGLNVCGAFEIMKAAKSLGTQIIHSHGYKGNILLGLLPRRFRNIPVLSTIHGSTSTKIISKMAAYEILNALAMKRLDSVVAVSASILENAIIRLLNLRPVIVNNGSKQHEFRKGVFEEKYPTLASKLIDSYCILAIGRLSPEKGFDILIRSISKLDSENIKAYLVIIGEGEERSRLTALISELGLVDSVHLLGYQPQAQRYLVDFDVFVISSITEGLPITMLEAMQAEIPIVATRVGEIPALLNNGELGELAIPNNQEDLSNALKRVYVARQSAKEKARKARQKAIDHYSVKNMAEQYHGIYKRIIRL